MSKTTDIEEILRNQVKVIGDGEWTLLGTPNNVIKELRAYIANEVTKGRLWELENLDYSDEYEDYFTINKSSIKERIAELKEQSHADQQ